MSIILSFPFCPPLFQNKRLGALNKFKAKARSILLATDVASRGLDIPHVDVVINFDIPTHSKVSSVCVLAENFWSLGGIVKLDKGTKTTFLCSADWKPSLHFCRLKDTVQPLKLRVGISVWLGGLIWTVEPIP